MPRHRRTQISVPFIDLKRHEPGFLERIRDKFGEMLAQAQFIGGPEVSRLESRLQDLTGTRHAITCANGTDALQLALRALGVGPGHTVLVPDVTFWATFESVVNVGATPATVDADLGDGGVSFDALEKAITDLRPKAAIIAHLYGWGSARLADIRNLCRQHRVLLIEDGAQSFGVNYRQASVYQGALISTTSFYPAKVLGGAGDGGAVFTDDPDLADRVRRLGNHGRTSHYGYADVGWNSRMDAIQAAYVLASLEHIEARIASRRQSAAFYRAHLPALGVHLINPPADYEENGYCNVCLIHEPERKSRLEARLKERNIGFGNIYPGAMSRQPGAQGVLRAHYGAEASQVLCSSVLNLPLFPYMTKEELEEVLSAVRFGLST